MQSNSDFDAKPMVMLLGQYSTGKTTFIKHLLKSSYPGNLNCLFSFASLFREWEYNPHTFFFHFFFSTGAHIGPEPTTDRFVVVMVCRITSKCFGRIAFMKELYVPRPQEMHNLLIPLLIYFIETQGTGDVMDFQNYSRSEFH